MLDNIEIEFNTADEAYKRVKNGNIIVVRHDDHYFGYFYYSNNVFTMEFEMTNKKLEVLEREMRMNIFHSYLDLKINLLKIFDYQDFKYFFNIYLNRVYRIKSKLLIGLDTTDELTDILSKLDYYKELYFKMNKNKWFEKLKIIFHSYSLEYEITTTKVQE